MPDMVRISVASRRSTTSSGHRPGAARGGQVLISYDIVEHGKPLAKSNQGNTETAGKRGARARDALGVCHSDLHIWEGYFDWAAASAST